MMKRYLFIVVCLLSLTLIPSVKSNAQIYNPYYAMYYGYGYMPLGNGYYIGQIYGGYPNGYGYIYYFDMNTGWTAYQGGFSGGLAHGQGQLLSSYGYIAGTWDRGNFVEHIHVNQNQIQQSYNNIMEQSYNYAPQNNNTISLPPGTEITEIDSSSELGSRLLGRMRK